MVFVYCPPDTQVEVPGLGSVVSSFECSVTNSRGTDQDIGSQFSERGERREMYGYGAASQVERGSRQIISVQGITFRCWNETFSIGNFVPDCTHNLSGKRVVGKVLPQQKL